MNTTESTAPAKAAGLADLATSVSVSGAGPGDGGGGGDGFGGGKLYVKSQSIPALVPSKAS